MTKLLDALLWPFYAMGYICGLIVRMIHRAVLVIVSRLSSTTDRGARAARVANASAPVVSAVHTEAAPRLAACSVAAIIA